MSNLSLKTETIIESFEYLEVSLYLDNSGTILDNKLKESFTDAEINFIQIIKSLKGIIPLSELFLYSEDKTFNGVINFILGSTIYELYNIMEQSISKEKIDIKLIISLLNKTYTYLIPGLNPDKNIETIKNCFRELKKYPPLEYAQLLMGKRFARISNYEKYFFVPIQSIKMRNFRLFNNKELVLFMPLESNIKNISAKQLADSLKVISDPTRLQIMKLLKQKAFYGKELAEKLNMKPPTITHHIDQLNKIELLNIEKFGNIKYFSLNRNKLKQIISELDKFTKI